MLYFPDYDQPDDKIQKFHIAQRLRSERKKAGFTLTDLVEHSGYSKPTIISWEKGWKEGTGENTIPTLKQVYDLSTIYNCNPGYLLCEYDQPTPQLADVFFETGLLPETAETLKRMFAPLRNQQMDEFGYNHALLQFINHFINHLHPLDDALYHRLIYDNLSHSFESSKYKDLILEGFKYVSVDRSTEFANLTGRLSPDGLFEHYRPELKDFYKNKGIDDYEIAAIIQEFKKYFLVLLPSGKSQADFVLSSCFMELVHSFLDSYPANVNSYKDSVDNSNWNESMKKASYIQRLQKLLKDNDIRYPVE